MSSSAPSDSDRPSARGSLFRAVLILLVFGIAARMQTVAALIPGYRELYDAHPFWVPEGMRSAVEILLVGIVVMAIHRRGILGTLEELGLRSRPWSGLTFGVLATAPMWVVFAFSFPLREQIDPPELAYLAGLSPLAEEIVFRGFAFGQLRRRAGWGFWWAVLVPALVFGLVHLRSDQDPGQRIGIFLITALGGLLFAFVYERWGYDLWAAFSLHAGMNLAWQVFAVGETALAGWLPTAMQAVVALLAVAIALGQDGIPWLKPSGSSAS